MRLVLIKKQEEKKEEESKRAPTFGSWVWENIKNIGEEISWVTEESEGTTEETKRRINIKFQKIKYIMGIETEKTEIECTMYDLVKTLSKEEWEWVAMDPKEVKVFKFETPSEWSPRKDPRPEWRIKETQIQVKEEKARRVTRKEEFQSRKSPVPEVCKSELQAGGNIGMPSLAIAGHSDNQNINVVAFETEHSDDRSDGGTPHESDFTNTGHKNEVSDKMKSGSTVSLPRDAKIAKTIQISAVDPQEPMQGVENQLLLNPKATTKVQSQRLVPKTCKTANPATAGRLDNQDNHRPRQS